MFKRFSQIASVLKLFWQHVAYVSNNHLLRLLQPAGAIISCRDLVVQTAIDSPARGHCRQPHWRNATVFWSADDLQ